MPTTAQVFVLLGSSTDLPVTEDGVALLRRLKLPYRLHICSAHRSPLRLHELVKNFEAATSTGHAAKQVYICVAGMSAHLAGVVASLTIKPVLAVPVFRPETAGLDALLSMGQMPKGIPVSTMGFGKAGFTNAVLTAVQIFALTDADLAAKLHSERATSEGQLAEDDAKHRQDYHG